MKKKLIVFLILSFIIFPLYSNSNSIISTKTLGMGKAGIADLDSFYNPANLNNRDDNSPVVVGNFSIKSDIDVSLISTYFGFFQYPNLSLGTTVYSQNLGLSLNLDNFIEDRNINNNILNYTAYNRFTLQLDWGYEYKDLEFGMSISGGSISKRSNFDLRLNYLFVSDYFVNIFFSNYSSISDSNFFSLTLSLSYELNENLRLAYLSDVDVDINSTDNVFFSYLKASSLAINYKSNKYSTNNQLNTFVYKYSIDLVNIGDSSSRELRMGGEIKIQIGNDNTIAFRAGYHELKPTIADIFLLDLSIAESTYAIAFENEKLSLVANINIPIESYSDLNNGLSVTLNALIEL